MLVTPDDLLVTSTNRRLSTEQKWGHVKIHANVYARVDALSPDSDFWVIGQRVTEARVLAMNLLGESSPDAPRPFGLQSAMVIHGLSSTDPSSPITRRIPSGPNRVIRLPEVLVGDTTIRPTVVRNSYLNVGPRTPQSGPFDLIVESLEEAAVDICRKLKPRIAIAEVSKIMRHLVGFDRRLPVSERKAEMRLKSEIRRINDDMPSRWRRRVADRVLALADAGADSPGEASLKWMVCSALEAGGVSALRVASQYRVSDGFSSYYLDLAIPQEKIAIEFDGMAKLETLSSDKWEKLREEKGRKDDLRAEGWRFIRIASYDMGNPTACMFKVVDRLNRLGVPAQIPEDW
ncbi:hypothetical protein U6G28_04690 [Actinomycetaceae bacterium MB13-C1-2]|nr:hypothetical protein U6G28_04690 [Actinomycetaceae bacterium MB13-C1-2]